MTHKISNIDHYWESETLHLPFAVEQGDGSAKPLTGATINWQLKTHDGQIVLSDDDTGVSTTIVDAAAGTFRVEIDADVTDGLGNQTYDERTTVIDDAGNKSIVGARFSISGL